MPPTVAAVERHLDLRTVEDRRIRLNVEGVAQKVFALRPAALRFAPRFIQLGASSNIKIPEANSRPVPDRERNVTWRRYAFGLPE